jgi:signal transduction histidine kinase
MTDGERLALLVHELRSPVAALEALHHAASAAGTDLPEDEWARILRLAHDACADIERLLTDTDLLSLAVGPVDLAALVDGLRRERVSAEADAGLVVLGDAVRLRQALGNLVENGLRHGSSVTVTAAAAGAEAHVTVADDGPGVDPGIDPFARGASAAGSTGLGLWVARAVAEAHGGTLELVSGPGAGAVFRLALPRASRVGG